MDTITLPSFPITGGCQCGAIRYVLGKAPVVFYLCHCRECQKQSSSAFGESLRERTTDLRITGSVASWSRPTASGDTVRCEFCPDCGTRLFHRRDKYRETLNIKGGSLDDPSWLAPAGHIWTASKQSWFQIEPKELAYEGQPQDEDAGLIARWAQMVGT